MRLSLVFLTIFVAEPIMGQYCPKECENQGIWCNIRCVFSNIQTEFAKNNENNSTDGGNRNLNPSATIPSSVASDVRATFRSLGTQGREIASEIKATAISISNNPDGFASSLATRISDGLNSTPTSVNLNEAFSSIEKGGNVVVSTLQSEFENGIGPTTTYSGSSASDFATTASIIGSEVNNFASTLSSRFNSRTSTTTSGSGASPLNSIESANILGIGIITLSSIVLSSFI